MKTYYFRHSYSGLFGTFLFNTVKDLTDQSVSENHAALDPDKSYENMESPETLHAIRLFSVWDYLSKDNRDFVNPAYDESSKKRLKCPSGVSGIFFVYKALFSKQQRHFSKLFTRENVVY